MLSNNRTEKKLKVFRVIADVALFFLIFIAPWWLSLVVVVACIFIFEYFYEALLFAVLLDGFHGVPGTSFFGCDLLFTAIISLALLVALFLRTKLKFY